MQIKIIRMIRAFSLLLISCGIAGDKPQPVLSLRKILMKPEWYQTQAGLWEKEVQNHPENANAWYHYYQASRYALTYEDGKTYEDVKQKNLEIVQAMEKHVPDSYEFNLMMGCGASSPLTNLNEEIRYLEKAYEMNPDEPLTYYALISSYERTRQTEKMKRFCEKLYASEDYAPGLYEYNYNVLVSVDEKAILFSNGDNDTYPVWVLQQVQGVRPDVVLLNLSLAQDLSYLKEKMRGIGMNISMDEFDLRALIETIQSQAPDRKLCFALTVADHYVKPFRNKLFCTGLVNRYTQTRFDNVALVRKNFETLYRLDYLIQNWYEEHRVETEMMNKYLHMNYVPGLQMLIDHYQISGEKHKAESWKALLDQIISKSGN